MRVARTCRALGVRSVAVYSDPDRDALHVRSCDAAVPLGGSSSRDSYLRIDKMVAAAREAGAQAVHPGYGFLSENGSFAEACMHAGLVFVGPPPEAMRAVGDKVAAKAIAARAGVPVVPGYSGDEQSGQRLAAEAERIGVPLLIKAAAGGGGRGMRRVDAMAEFASALQAARREAANAFGDDRVFLERLVIRPRHIEVQILGDSRGVVLALGERDCSIQRRYQKLLEESPSPAVGPNLRQALQEAAVAVGTAVGYRNAGTVEFMLQDDGTFYFLEVNARLQVEHPVTEMVTGIDLVAEQLWIAAGHPISLQSPVTAQRAHAIEVRIYAEDPAAGFLPSTGRITTFQPPSLCGLRHDVAVEPGSAVSPLYDPLIAKLIACAPQRLDAIALLRRALDEYLVGGVATNIGFLRWLVERPEFASGQAHTDFLESFDPAQLGRPDVGRGALAAAACQSLAAWRHSAAPRAVELAEVAASQTRWLRVQLQWSFRGGAWIGTSNGGAPNETQARIQLLGNGVYLIDDVLKVTAWREDDSIWVCERGAVIRFGLPPPPSASAGAGAARSAGASSGAVVAPMAGTIAEISVKERDRVKALDLLLVMEAMKMEHRVVAPHAGTIAQIKVKAGQAVAAGEDLILVAPP